MRLPSAFIDVNAKGSVGLEAFSASTGSICTTLGIVGTVEIGLATRSYFSRFTTDTSITLEPGWAFACVPGNAIHAGGAEATTIERSAATFINV